MHNRSYPIKEASVLSRTAHCWDILNKKNRKIDLSSKLEILKINTDSRNSYKKLIILEKTLISLLHIFS